MNEQFMMDKISDHDKRIGCLEKSQVKAETLLEQFMKTSDELSGTMKEVSTTMTEMKNSLSNNSKEICEINKKIDSINTKVDTETNKSKIDMRDISREGMTKILTNLGKAGIGASAIYGIYELIK